jgi:microcystin-dependent protein
MSFNDMTNEQVVARYGGTTWERIQDRYLVAAGSSSHIVGSTGGSSTVTLTENNLPEHSHNYYRSSTSTGSHTLTTNEMPSHSHSSFDGGVPWGSDWNDNERQMTCRSAIERSWTPTTNAVGGGGSHYHSITRSWVASGSTGSGTAFSIEPPYIAIYMWRRTA